MKYSISGGTAGMLQTIYAIIALANGPASRLPRVAIPDLDGWMARNWTIIDDVGHEQIRTLDVLMQDFTAGRLGGDCDDAAVWALGTARVMGCPTAWITALRAPHDSEFRHVLVSLWAEGRPWKIDPCGDQEPDYTENFTLALDFKLGRILNPL